MKGVMKIIRSLQAFIKVNMEAAIEYFRVSLSKVKREYGLFCGTSEQGFVVGTGISITYLRESWKLYGCKIPVFSPLL
jgi:hypothetical protein